MSVLVGDDLLAGPRRWRAVLAALALGLAACTTGNDAVSSGGSFTFVSPGGVLEFSYPTADRGTIGDLSGKSVSGDGDLAVSDYSGQVVVLNFWGSWCSPCRAETNDLENAATELASKDVQFLGINVRDTRSDAADFLTSKKVSYPSIYDPSLRTMLSIRGYPTTGIPSTIVIDKLGRIAHIWLHSITTDELVEVATAVSKEET